MKKINLLAILFLIPTLLTAEIKLSASKSSYDVNGNANANGVYPVELTWTSTTKTSFIGILRSESSDTGFVQIAELSGTKTSYTDANPEAVAQKKFYYQVIAYNTKSSPVEKSTIQAGWGALTQERYFITFNKAVIRSHNRLVLMNKKRNLDKLGKETLNGLISGTLDYKTKLKLDGLSGYVVMYYENFTDDNIWNFTGNMDTQANIAGNGKMFGTVEIKGMYPGKIYYENVEIKDSKAGGGTYGVEPSGTTRKNLEYTWTFKE